MNANTWQHEQQKWTDAFERRLPDRLAWAIRYVGEQHDPDKSLADHFDSLAMLLQAAHTRSALHPLALDLIEALHPWPTRWGHWSAWESELRFAAEVAERTGQPRRQADFLANLAHALITLGHLDETLVISAQALELARQQQTIEPWAIAGAAFIAACLEQGESDRARQAWTLLDRERAAFSTASESAQRIAHAHLALQHVGFLNQSGQNEAALAECGQLISALENLPTAPLDLIANIYSWRGVLLHHRGQYADASAATQRALELGQQAGDIAFTAGEWGNLGMIYMSLGDLDHAKDAYLQATTTLKDLNVMGQYINALGTLGAVYLLCGELDKALDCLNEQLILAESLNYVRETARALNNRGAVLMYQGRYAEGVQDIEACQPLLTAQGRQAIYIGSLIDLGYCYVGLGDIDRAQQMVHAALQQAEELNLPGLRVIALRCLASVEPVQRVERLREALSLARRLKRRLDEAGCLLVLAGWCEDETERLRLWSEGARLLQQCGANAWLAGHSPDNPPMVAMAL